MEFNYKIYFIHYLCNDKVHLIIKLLFHQIIYLHLPNLFIVFYLIYLIIVLIFYYFILFFSYHQKY